MATVRDHRIDEKPPERIGKPVRRLASSGIVKRDHRINEKPAELIGRGDIGKFKAGQPSAGTVVNDMKANQFKAMAPLGAGPRFAALKNKLANPRAGLTNPGALSAWMSQRG